MERTNQTGAEFSIEFRGRMPDGSVRWFEASGSAVCDEAGQPVRAIGLVRDITRRKEVEETLQATNRRLAQALADLQQAQEQSIQQERLSALGELASGVVHEFNNALAPIAGYSELLLANPRLLHDEQRTREYLETIHLAARDAVQIVNRLRAFYRPRLASEGLLEAEPREVVAQALALTQPRWMDQARARGAPISVKNELGALSPVRVDPAELREIFVNLIINAVDARPDGGTLTIRGSAEGNRVRLEVADSGIGMSDETRRRCLEPFYTTKGSHGTGLGLAIVYGAIRRVDGRLDIASCPAQGTTVSLWLPIVAQASSPLTADAKRPDHIQRGLTPSLRILVVDDDGANRQLLLDYLRQEGHRALAAEDGRDGEEKLREGHFDLVITDRSMPGRSGDQLALTVRRESPLTPVIMLTGFGGLMQAAGERPPGVDVLMSKPTHLGELRAAIEQLTRRATADPAAEEPIRHVG
jgi:signal transduction histidine kinase/ActR/RegA family two-component response regulator